MQGSGTYAVEATIGTAMPRDTGTMLIAMNGAYGERMGQIADYLGIHHLDLRFDEREPVDPAKVATTLAEHPEITHFAMVHCETTTGIMNPLEAVAQITLDKGIISIIDAMSSFGGVPIDLDACQVDYLISSSNKCVQGVPGFAFVLAKSTTISQTAGNARSLSLDLYDQYESFENKQGKWRFTSPTHTVYAFAEALDELLAEGGASARNHRYQRNESVLRAGMIKLGYQPVIDEVVQSPIITSFAYPTDDFDFTDFYQYLKAANFIIYPGKVSQIDSFRIGNIGQVTPADIDRLLRVIATYPVAVTN